MRKLFVMPQHFVVHAGMLSHQKFNYNCSRISIVIPKINELQAKSVFTKSGLPASDWVINPYNGCLFGCMYCYATQIARWKHPTEQWGSYLDVKLNAPEVLARELTALEKRRNTKDFGSVFFSSVTDPYVGLEAKYRLTRKCLPKNHPPSLLDFSL